MDAMEQDNHESEMETKSEMSSEAKERSIDLNCDMGEWDADDPNPDQQLRDRAIMPFVSSVNIASGGHRGDADSLKATMEQAAVLGLAIGLHPSFMDRDGFGRIDGYWNHDLADGIRRQLDLGRKVAEELGLNIHHIKPHGALYNLAARDEDWAEKLWALWRSWDEHVLVYGLSGSEVSKGLGLDVVRVPKARSGSESDVEACVEKDQNSSLDFGIDIQSGYRAEVFADRTYEPNLQLRSRSLPGAVIENSNQLEDQLRDLVLHGRVLCTDGVYRRLEVDTMCLHSDTPGAVEFAQAIAARLREWEVEVRPC